MEVRKGPRCRALRRAPETARPEIALAGRPLRKAPAGTGFNSPVLFSL